MLDIDFRLDYSDGTFEIRRAAGFASIADAKASLDITADVEFVSTVGMIDRKPQECLAW